MKSKKVEWLSWRGYTERKRISLAGWTEGFSMPARYLERVPYCVESYKHLRGVDVEKRIEMQKYMLDSTDHSVMGSIYLGVMRPREMEWLRDQLEKCVLTILSFVQMTASDDIQGDELARVFKQLSPDSARYFRSALESSLYFYANGKVRKPFAKILQQPMYMEFGIDVLTCGLQFMLAEFQVRYATPYPHLLDDFNNTYETIVPELFTKFGLQSETFAKRRLEVLTDCFERFEAGHSPGSAGLPHATQESPTRIVLDAWAYLDNKGANWKTLVPQLQAEYILFDDLLKTQNVYEKQYRNKRLCIFNQPPLNLIDPPHSLFERVNAEKLETYDELCWTDLLERYLNNQVFLANSPLADMVNDKALYTVIPEMSQILFGESIELPIVETLPCWDLDDYTKPNEEVLKLARDQKDDYVIAHRYLEGGMGIRVGHVTTMEEWDSFIETFVIDRPYLYVLRSRFEMDPDMSVRVLAATSMPSHTADVQTSAKCELADTLYARLTTEPPLGADNHRSFLIYRTSPDAPEPDYQFEEPSLR